jgi:hypothetical protein
MEFFYFNTQLNPIPIRGVAPHFCFGKREGGENVGWGIFFGSILKDF